MEFYTKNKNIFEVLIDDTAVSNTFITFKYILPFRLPFLNGTEFCLNNIVFVVLQREYEHHFKDTIFSEQPHRHTIIETTLKLEKYRVNKIKKELKKSGYKRTIELNREFNLQLDELNAFVNTIITKNKKINLYEISNWDIISMPIFSIFTYHNAKIEDIIIKEIFILNRNNSLHEMNSETLTDYEVREIVDAHEQLKGSPYINVILWVRKAQRAYNLGHFSDSIVLFNTMFEVFVVTIISRYYILLDLKSLEKIHNITNKENLKNLLKQHLYDILRDLNIKDYDLIHTLIENYLKKGYKYRNNIVHSGEKYGQDVALEVYEFINNITILISHNLKQNDSNKFTKEYCKWNGIKNPADYQKVIDKFSN